MNKTNQLTRREFLRYAAGLGISASGMALLSACGIQPAAPTTVQLETTTIKLTNLAASCYAPQYVAEEFLRSEGFSDVQYTGVSGGPAILAALDSGKSDISMTDNSSIITGIDSGEPIVALSGIHSGCFELFATEQVNSIRDMRGKTVAVPALGSGRQIFLSALLAYVGVDPKSVQWVAHPFAEVQTLLAAGKIDAYLGFPPEPQELRAKQIGRVILSTMMDKPWSQYLCCQVIANREFVRKNPVATKRALRAILKASDVCAREPERVARFIVDKGYLPNYDYALQMLRESQAADAYNQWRELDPEDTLRFYALQLNEVGAIKTSPNDIIARGTDWSFLKQLKQEMKGFASASSYPFYCQVS